MSSFIKKVLRRAALPVMAVISVFVFSACGAKVSTRLYIDNDGFKGSRTVTAILSSGDLKDNVTGGEETLEKVIKKYIPDGVTYTHVPDNGADYTHTVNEGDVCYTFKFEFSDFEDYKKKVTAILKAAPENSDFTPEMTYENLSSVFKESLYLKENFSSIDLLDWLTYGLQEEGIVTHSSTSDWYENGYNYIVYGGKDYSSSSNLNIDNSEYHCPDSIEVTTRLNGDGTFDRSFDFTFAPGTAKDLEDKGADLDGYFGGLSSAKMSKPENERGNVVFRLELTGSDAQTVASETKKILADDSAEFSVKIGEYNGEDKKYDIRIDVTESMNGGYYLRRSPDGLSSKFYFPKGVEFAESEDISLRNGYNDDDERYFYYNYPKLEDGKKPSFTMGWKLAFETVGAEIAFSGSNPSLTLDLSVTGGLMAAAKDLQKSKLEKALPDGVKLSEESGDEGLDVFKVSMGSGSDEDIANRYKQFIYAYTGEKAECSFSSRKVLSGSLFKNLNTHSAVFDMSSIADGKDVKIVYKTAIGEKVYIPESGSFIADAEQESGSYTGTSGRYVRFSVVNETVSIAGIIIMAAIILFAVVFAAVTALNAKSWIGMLGSMPKPAVQTPAPAKAAAPSAAQTPAQSAAQSAVQNTAKPAAENKQAEEKSDDENEEEFI